MADSFLYRGVMVDQVGKYEELLPLIEQAAKSEWGIALQTSDRVLLREQINQAKRDTEYHRSVRVLTPRHPGDELWLIPRNENLSKSHSTYIATT